MEEYFEKQHAQDQKDWDAFGVTLEAAAEENEKGREVLEEVRRLIGLSDRRLLTPAEVKARIIKVLNA